MELSNYPGANGTENRIIVPRCSQERNRESGTKGVTVDSGAELASPGLALQTAGLEDG